MLLSRVKIVVNAEPAAALSLDSGGVGRTSFSVGSAGGRKRAGR
jgi:hypothetical protein